MKFWFKALTLSSILGIILLEPSFKVKAFTIPSPSHPLPLSSPLPFFPSPVLAQLTTATSSTINGKIDSSSEKTDNGNYYNVHTLEGKAGKQITVEVISNEFEPVLTIFAPDGNIDYTGGGNSAKVITALSENGIYQISVRLSVAFPKNGSYTINVSSRDEKKGNYTLTWRNTTENDLKLAEVEQLNLQFIQLYQQRKYEDAIAVVQNILAIREEVLGIKHPYIATSLNVLAKLYEEQGNYSDAEPLLQRALAIREEVLEAKHLDTAISLEKLAVVYQFQGNYSAAEPLLQRALAIREEVLGVKHLDTAISLNNLALLYQNQGNHTAAEPLLQHALAIREEVLGAKNRDTAISLNNLAMLYQAQGNYNAAEPLYQRALAIYEEILGAKRLETAFTLNNLAELYREQGNYSAAEPFHQRALAIFEENLGTNHPIIATALNNLALLYLAQDNYKIAEPLFQRALTITEEVLGAKHPETAQSFNNLAVLYYAQGNIPLALNYLTKGTDIQEYNLDLNLATGSEQQKRDYMATIAKTTDATISLHLQDASDNPNAARLALTTLLRRKARILDVLGDSLQTLRNNLTPESQKLLDELNSTRSQLAALLYNPPQNLSNEQYKAQFDNLKTQEEQLEATLARKSAEFHRQNEPVTIEAVQKLIPADAVLVEIVLYYPLNTKASQQGKKWGKPHYAAYILDSNRQIQWVELGEAEPIDNAILAFRDALQNPSSNIKPLARNLDEKLMQPIRQKLGNTRHILLSPDSQLNLIPFAALVNENDRYLVENYTITYLTTGRDLIQIAEPLPSQQSPVILANPDFDTSNSTTLVATKERGTDNRRSGDITSLKFGSLPGTKLEADAISKLLSDVTLLTQSQATENALKRVKSPQILHLATHGFFLQDVEMFQGTSLPDDRGGVGVFARPNAQKTNKPTNSENPLLRSGIALAGFNLRSSSGEDGVLTALEATSLNLQGTKLVVLSACETGVGDITNGEGVYGLRRAFVLAGSESQVFSLWKVDDAATKDLMVQYYQRILKGEERSEGMRQTQLEMLASSNRNHPYYWAAFLPSGDWRAMK